MFSKILIANRGEIAVRIIRACKEMGISSVAVYSQADSESIHATMADECICIGSHQASNTYLNKSAIITAALVTGCQAIHPGYGFLAENAEFAALCKKHELVFIGPDADVIAQMGDKDIAKKTMIKAGVPTVPGSGIIENTKQLKIEAEKIGYPLLIKAKAGGGGRGIRLVKDQTDDIEKAYLIASAEAKSAFGDGGVYLEKYLYPVKHIEVQILADEKGNTVCLPERECSIQLKNQKLLEESPSVAISKELREKMMSVAAKAAKAAGYVNAGTIEFLLDKNNNFYFMEMNTRLQVEHPVTEMVTGIDIVKWQIRIAAGVLLNFDQKDIEIKGCSIECRINADTSVNKNAGEVTFLHVPGGPQVRFDTFLYQGYKIPPYYDSLLAKLIIQANTREEAIRKMKASLCELVIEGVGNNINKQIDILSDEDFCVGEYYTNFMEKRG